MTKIPPTHDFPNVNWLIDVWYATGLSDGRSFDFCSTQPIPPEIVWETLGLNLALAGLCEAARRGGLRL